MNFLIRIQFLVINILLIPLSYAKLPYNVEFIQITPEITEKLKHQPLKVILQTDSGQKITAYLYAEDERKEPYTKMLCHSNESQETTTTTISTVGHYYIYLYDEAKKQFMPYRTRIDKFTKDGELTFNTEGAGLAVMPGARVKKQMHYLLHNSVVAWGRISESLRIFI